MQTISLKKSALVLIGLTTLLPACSWGSKTESAQEMAAPAEDMASKLCEGNVVIVNVLDKPIFEDAHIKGSINVPFEEAMAMTDEDFAKRGWDKQATKLIVHCGNYACGSSAAIAESFAEKGFAHVFAYEGGTAEWKNLGNEVVGKATEAYLNEWQKPQEEAAAPVEGDVVAQGDVRGGDLGIDRAYQMITAEDLKRTIDECLVNA